MEFAVQGAFNNVVQTTADFIDNCAVGNAATEAACGNAGADIATVLAGGVIGATGRGSSLIFGSKTPDADGSDAINQAAIDAQNPNNPDGIDNGTTIVIDGDLPVVRVDADNVRRGTPEFDILNNPPPNTRIELSNGNVYITNEAGFVTETSFQPRLEAGVRDSRGPAAGKEGLETDIGGHLQPCSQGGTCDRVNLIPQDSKLNSGTFRSHEIAIQNALKAGDDVGPVTIRLIRKDPNSARPDTIAVEYSINGRTFEQDFENKPGG